MPKAAKSGQGKGGELIFPILHKHPLQANAADSGLNCTTKHFMYHYTTDLSARRAQAIFIRSNAMPTKPAYLQSA